MAGEIDEVLRSAAKDLGRASSGVLVHLGGDLAEPDAVGHRGLAFPPGVLGRPAVFRQPAQLFVGRTGRERLTQASQLIQRRRAGHAPPVRAGREPRRAP